MSEPEYPRSEPEILPPERKSGRGPFRESRRGDRPQGFRIYVGRISPLQMTIYAVVAVLVVAAILFLFASLLVVVIPAVALLAATGFVVAFLRRSLKW